MMTEGPGNSPSVLVHLKHPPAATRPKKGEPEVTKQLLIRDTPHELKSALMQAAQDQDSNVQAVAVGILAREFQMTFTPGRARANGADVDNPTLPLRMPAELHQRLRVRAAEEGIAHADLALLILGKHLGIEIEAERLNRRRGRKAAA